MLKKRYCLFIFLLYSLIIKKLIDLKLTSSYLIKLDKFSNMKNFQIKKIYKLKNIQSFTKNFQTKSIKKIYIYI